MTGSPRTDEPAGLRWHTSSHSNANGGQCVQIAVVIQDAWVRDSKSPTLGRVAFSFLAMNAFLSQL